MNEENLSADDVDISILSIGGNVNLARKALTRMRA